MRSAYRFCLLLTVLFALSSYPVTALAQTRSRKPRTPRQAQPKPDRRLTLLVSVVRLNAPGQALVETQASETIEKPTDLTEPFSLSVNAKTKYHYPNQRPTPFVVGETIVVRADLYGTPPQMQALAREIWDTETYAADQRVRKELAVGKVLIGLSPEARTGTLTITREDGTRADYRVTEKSRFCKNDVQVSPETYTVGMPLAVKPRSLPSGGAMASIVAENAEAVDHAYRDTLTVWHGILENVDYQAFFLTMRREDGVKRKVRFPKVIKIMNESDVKKGNPGGKVYHFAELLQKPIIVHLVRGERPDPDGTRTADRISTTVEETLPVPAPTPTPAKKP